MWNGSNPVAALCASWTGSSIGRRRRFTHTKGRGALADARANVLRVHTQVRNFEQSCEWHDVDETDETIRCVDGLFFALRRHEAALEEYTEENVEAMDSLERASGNLVAAASTLYAIDPLLFRVKCGVELLSAVRGLDSKEAFERYLADLEMIAEDRRERAAFFKERREEGYTDANGKEYSPADLAEKAEREAARRADPMASRSLPGGNGLQDTASNEESMRARQDWRAADARRNPHRLRDAVDAAHKERNAPPPPRGSQRSVHGYVVQGHLVPPGEPNPPTWDDAEITRRVAEFRKRTGVRELDPSVHGTYVHEEEGRGWRVEPPVAVLRRIGVKERTVYNDATRACVFPEKAEADVVLEKFMAQSTSDVERKAIMGRPREAFICAHCGKGWLDRRQSTGVRLMARQKHERLCPEQSSSSSSEEESEDESEEEESEEVEPSPSPKRARSSWSLGGWWRSSE